MREIINPWTHTDGYNCYGCCPTNPIGAHMRFYEEDENNLNGDIVSAWTPTQNHQSWLNTLHGGVQATLLDEVCGWVVFKKLQTSGVTARFELKYKQAVSTIGGPLLLRARLLTEKHRVAVVAGELMDAEGKVLTTCECTYFTFPADKAQEMGFIKAALSEEDYTLQQVIERSRQQMYRSLRNN